MTGLQIYTFQKRKLEVEVHPEHFLVRGWTRGKDGPPYTMPRKQWSMLSPEVVKACEAVYGPLEQLETV